jgi:hypothetical protein
MHNKRNGVSALRIIALLLFITAMVLIYLSYRPGQIIYQVVPISPFQNSSMLLNASGFLS